MCADEPYIQADFEAVDKRLSGLVSGRDLSGYASSSGIDRVKALIETGQLHSALLPIRTVGVQGDGRTYSYVAAISSEHPPSDWAQFVSLAKFITRNFHVINLDNF